MLHEYCEYKNAKSTVKSTQSILRVCVIKRGVTYSVWFWCHNYTVTEGQWRHSRAPSKAVVVKTTAELMRKRWACSGMWEWINQIKLGFFSGGWLKEPGGFTQEAAAINTKRTWPGLNLVYGWTVSGQVYSQQHKICLWILNLKRNFCLPTPDPKPTLKP